MKKSLYYVSAAAVLLAACNEDYSDWAPAQSSSEEESATVAEGAVTALAPLSGATEADAYQLMALSSDKGQVTLTKLYLDGSEIAFSLENDTLSVAKSDLDKTVRDNLFSLAAVERELTFTGNWAMLNDNGEATPLNVEPVKIKYTPAPLPANAQETEFWYVGGHNSWDLSLDNPDKMTDNGDGTYSITLNIGDSEWFAFAPKSAIESSDWNALFRAPENGYTGKEGFLDNDPTTGWSFCCEKGGQYTFILDMVNYTFRYFNYIEKEYFYIGAANGDNQSKAYPLSNGGKDPLENPVFTVTVPATGGWHWFKIAPGSGFNEDGTWNWDNEYTCACAVNSDDDAMSGKFVIGGNKYSWHILEDQYPAKFYRLSFNFLTQEYSITPINYSDYIYYAGDWTSWGDNKKEMSLVDTSKGLYEGYYFIKAVDNANTWGFKFVDADGAWYGNSNGVLSTSGDNCDPGEEGFYKISVNWASMSYELTKIETISLIGDATGDSSWGTDLDMTWDGTCWTYTGALKAGSFKFRANHDWNGINWGGDPANLVMDKDNASIAADGTYTIKLYCNCPGKATYTIETSASR